MKSEAIITKRIKPTTMNKEMNAGLSALNSFQTILADDGVASSLASLVKRSKSGR
jgi:hypothetical protein